MTYIVWPKNIVQVCMKMCAVQIPSLRFRNHLDTKFNSNSNIQELFVKPKMKSLTPGNNADSSYEVFF